MPAGWFKEVPVLMYHKITERFEVGVTTVTPLTFKKHIQYLKDAGYTAVTTAVYTDPNPPEKPVIISFDDGYECTYEHGFPILAEVGFPGLVFPILDSIGKWNDWDANLGGIRFRHMTASQLRQLHQAGWEIGAHSRSHQIPALKADPDDELITAKADLEDLVNTNVHTFSYPFGHIPADILQRVQTHYRYAMAATIQSSTDAFRISRAAVYRTDSIRAFKNKLKCHIFERLKLRLIHAGASATRVYQSITQTKRIHHAQ